MYGYKQINMAIVSDNTDHKTIQSVDRSFDIIEYIQENNGASLVELTDAFEISKSAIHYHLNTLMKYGWVVKEEERYRIGLRFLDQAMHSKNQREEYQIVQPKVAKLSEETGERAQFIIEENGRGIHVYSELGENGIQSNSRVGKLVYLHATSAGKAILASMDKEEVESIIDAHGLPKMTGNTITTREELFETLEETRERGYAFNRAERRNGLMAMGAPVKDPSGRVLGALSVTGPVRRMQDEHQDYLPDLLLDVTEETRLRLEYPQ
jgi:DNA-binding IclR family transcriptional regulator